MSIKMSPFQNGNFRVIFTLYILKKFYCTISS
nr:MAG TPA_asm: hypothetical protein [Caudoviricetes sp.]DAT50608.1 MAG TPA: hypothetical protein [Bacteriophage sp.]DAU82393.1 MAG TPA: hypothetical protein [Bacteriophage sp.]DAW65935.1 MAG TPA: hypothetical protein [Bacteriophage sp.]DAZ43698.1 MAG TPA: hypothetical protein [Caudoviricetes sp.]